MAKKESDVKIKLEPDQMSTIDDEDQYEDTGELQFTKVTDPTWLMRTPKELWNGLSNLKKDGDKIKIGDMLVWSLPDGTQKVRWKLENNLPGFDLIAKEYDVQVQPTPPRNTFCFSERGAIGFRKRVTKDTHKIEGSKVQKRRPRQVTKHTAFMANPTNETQCNPRETDEWFRLQARKEAIRRKNLKETIYTEINQHEQQTQGNKFAESFIKTVGQKKVKNTEGNYQRLERDALIEAIGNCFREYKAWHLRSLKEKLKQPEQWLRENLSNMAYMVRTGAGANTWRLKPELAPMILGEGYDAAVEINDADIAPPQEGEDLDNEGSSDLDDDEEMEDVNV